MKRENCIQDWGRDRGITIVTAEGTPRRVKAQVKKLRSEYEEMLRDNTPDDVGDQYVVLSMIAGCYGTTASRCRYAVRDMLPKGYYPTSLKDRIETIEWVAEQNAVNKARQEILTEVGLYVRALEQKAESEGWTLEGCLEVAWDGIKDRGGVLVHDTFVKESNLALLETYGISPKLAGEGQLILEGIVDKSLYDLAVEMLYDNLGYDYEAEDWTLDYKLVWTTGVAE